MTKISMLGICGSIRKGSLNQRALDALGQSAESDVEWSTVSLRDVPIYDPDVDSENLPAAVQALKDAIARADGIIIATPEYNYGIPGVLKNAIDWASRPAYKSVFAQKPVTILGASPGPVGTARAQGQLKQVLLGMVADVFPFPEVTIAQASEKLGPGGVVSDEKTEDLLRRLMVSYSDWLRARQG
jgi:chromate reductase